MSYRVDAIRLRPWEGVIEVDVCRSEIVGPAANTTINVAVGYQNDPLVDGLLEAVDRLLNRNEAANMAAVPADGADDLFRG